MRAKAPAPVRHLRDRSRPARAPASPKKRSVVATSHPYLVYGRRVLELEAKAIASLSLGPGFVQAIDLLLACKGHLVVTGIGKPGFIAQNLSAILASTGTPSLYLHPAEAVHGDLGRVTPHDVILALSNSGQTEELLRLLTPLKRIGAKLIAVTGNRDSPLAKAADAVVDIGRIDEACPMGLVPTTSSAALHAVCDALAMTLLKNKPFTTEEYALYHPGGSLGRKVMKVHELMRAGPANPVVAESEPLSRAVVVMTNTVGRPGAASIVDRRGKLVGMLTDGDLRRLIERGHQDFNVPVGSVMCKSPKTCGPDDLVAHAASRMRETKVDQLPVVDAANKPVGLLDVQDLLAARFL